MIKEEEYLEESIDHLDQMDVIADEITIGSDRFLNSTHVSNRQSYGILNQQLQSVLINQKSSQPNRIIINNKESNSNPSTLKVIKLPTKGSNQTSGGTINKPLRIITVPKGHPVTNSSKTVLISGSSQNSNMTNSSSGNQFIKLATPEGRVIHVKSVASSTSKPGTFIIAKMPQGITNRAVTRCSDGTTRHVIVTQKASGWTESNGVLPHPLADQQQNREEKVPHHLMSSSLARALTLSPGSLTPGMGLVGPLIQPSGHNVMDVDMAGDSGDEATLAYNAALKSNGLRKYAQSVCQKVRDKGITSYNEVADELVQEYAAENPMIPQDQLQYHQKNIRRRVYDALNVLMAMQIITKEKKEIRWVGLPVNAMQEKKRLEGERDKRMTTFKEKVQEVEELILQLIAHKSLIARNRCHERVYGLPHDNAVVELPFITMSTNKKTVINCYISDDKTNYLLNFDQSFEMHDHVDTLRAMGLNLNLGSDICSENEYQQCLELVPTALRFYVEAMYERRPPIEPDLEAVHEQRRSYLEAKLAAAASGNIYLPSALSGRNSSSVGNIFHDGGLLHNQHSIHNSGYSHDICDEEDDDLEDLDVDNELESDDDDRGRSETDAELGVS